MSMEKPAGQKRKGAESPREKMKYEIAAELGLMDKINGTGWKSLTARESGKIGGILAKREKDMKKTAATGEESREGRKE